MKKPSKPPTAASLAITAWLDAQKVLREKFDTPEAVAKAIGVSRQAVWKWAKVPPLQVHRVSNLTGIRPYELRPDLPELFPKP